MPTLFTPARLIIFFKKKLRYIMRILFISSILFTWSATLMIKNSLILFLSIFLFACTTTPLEVQNEVESGDWGKIGTYDGSNGYIEKTLSDLQELSKKYDGKKVDLALYQSSYLAAVTIYCKSDNATKIGLLGEPYRHVCDRFPNGQFFYQDWLSAKESLNRAM